MRDENLFDLDCAIRQWREKLAQAPAMRRENLEELESHLRDSVASLQAHGLNAEEAFLIAGWRIGTVNRLEPEFCKVNGAAVWTDRVFWMLIGYQAWSLVFGIVGFAIRNTLFFGLSSIGFDFKSHYGPVVTLFTLAHLCGFIASLALCWWIFRKRGRLIGPWFGQQLSRRSFLIIAFTVLYLLSLAVPLMNGLTSAIVSKLYTVDLAGGFFTVLSISSAITQLIMFALLAGLTLSLAESACG
jgi:hypothetical protein